MGNRTVRPTLLPLLILALAMLLLPPAGAILSSHPLGDLLALPLDEGAWDPLPLDPDRLRWFSIALGIWVLGTIWLAWPRRLSDSPLTDTERLALGTSPGPWPRTAIWGLLCLGAAITTALAALPGLSLPLLLLGLTLVIGADTQRRTGSSLVSTRPGYFLLLFAASASLGWLYYWLNLFLQLWTYPGSGTEPGAAIPFTLTRTLGYAMLLPALLALRQWLGSWPRMVDWLSRARPLGGGERVREGWIFLSLAGLGLAGAAVWPDWIMVLTWLAPIFLIMGLQHLSATPCMFSGTRRGDWTRILLPGASAVILGMIAQAWNTLTGPTWVFQLPQIHAYPIFGLPLVAYAGLIPMGLVGVWVADQLAHPWRRHPLRPIGPSFPVRISIKP